MERFKDYRLAGMSSSRFCLIRDLGLVKGGKGLRHHEVAPRAHVARALPSAEVRRVRWTDEVPPATATTSTGVRRVARILRGTAPRT